MPKLDAATDTSIPSPLHVTRREDVLFPVPRWALLNRNLTKNPYESEKLSQITLHSPSNVNLKFKTCVEDVGGADVIQAWLAQTGPRGHSDAWTWTKLISANLGSGP